MSVCLLVPVLVRSESSSEVMFADFSSGSLYFSSGAPVPEGLASDIFSELDEDGPDIPYKEIRAALATERNLSQENSKHIFRRGV